MEIFILCVFIVGYLAITLEHNIKTDKLIPAIIMMALAWAGIAFGLDDFTQWFNSHEGKLIEGFQSFSYDKKLHLLESTLLHHFGKTCEILIFLIGAMTIVELVDYFNGFQTIKSIIKTRNKKILLWIVCGLGFVLSAIIDNLTATIVLITILRKIISDKKLRIWYAGLIIISANAGGAWSPIGDVTTTMLWMGSKVSADMLVVKLLIPSIACMIIPTFIASFLPVFKGEIPLVEQEKKAKYSTLMLVLGLGMIVFVPIFKVLTHLPPYIGMMLSLGIVSLVSEIISNKTVAISQKNSSGTLELSQGEHHSSPTFKALSKIEMPSILFFLGILMTVAALESLGMIFVFGQDVVNSGMNINLFVILLGAGSAVIDNVPLVAASMGMFQQPENSRIWHFIAYAAGTGGSMLIIGSAAGVVAMGMEKISFFWYVKNITLLAIIGYLAGVGVFLLLPW